MSRHIDADVLDPRQSVVPACAAFCVGVALFLVDAAVNPRPGPVAYLLTPTPVALLLYRRLRPTAGRRRLVAVAVWGLLGTAVAGLLTVVVALGTRLPRPYEAWELFLFDLGTFLWFVLALSLAFVVAARTRGARATAAFVAGRVAQFLGFVLTVLVTADDVVLVAVGP